MPWVTLPGIGAVHVKMPKPRRVTCAECGTPTSADRLCDGPPQPSLLEPDPTATCSQPICARCAIRVGAHHDFCRQPACRAAAAERARQLRTFPHHEKGTGDRV